MVAPVVSVHVRGLQYSHSSAVTVLSDVDLDLGPGLHGLVGGNGAGKSTLLDLLDGSRQPGGGDITVIGAAVTARVRQDLDHLTDQIVRFGERWDGHAVSLRRRLGLDVDDLWQWDTRSPGCRMQWQVAAAVAARPDMLLLDEPTNHLDAHARQMLVDLIRHAEIPMVIVVSHDRSVLDELTQSTLRIVDGDLQQWAGSWSQARRLWQAQEAATRDAHDRARKDAALAHQRVAAARSNLSGIEVGAAATRRTAGKGDPDARGALAKHNAAAAARSLATTVNARRGTAQRADQAVDDTRVRRHRGGQVTALGTAAHSATVATLQAAELRADDRVVLHDVDVVVRPSDRIRVDGANGAGKSTLVAALVSSLEPHEVGVVLQEVSMTAAQRDRVLGTPDRPRMLAILDHLGVSPDRVMQTDFMSPGESRKLALASLLVQPRQLLVLDEPTTHLDIDAISRLQTALVDHAGAMVLVTHDHDLAAATTTIAWEVANGRVHVSENG